MRFSLLTISLLASLAIAAPLSSKRDPHHTEAQIAAKAKAAGVSSATPSATSAAVAVKAKASKTKTSAAATATATSSSTTTTASTGGALVASAYNTFQISGGTAGTAEAEANALFTSVDTTNLAGVSAADLKVISGIHDAAEDAETDAFNPAIAAASGTAATALQNGKIKNKVLKLTAEVLADKIKAAQGDSSATADAAAEQVKLTNNIKLDTAAAGQASTAVSFDATS